MPWRVCARSPVLRRVESDDPLFDAPAVDTPPHVALESDTGILPHGHPKWIRDGISISQRARSMLAKLRPVVLHVLHFWDHGMRSILIAGRRLRVDPSGSYRVD
jgi:hypothetical protein